MTKKEIYKVRAQVHGATTDANNSRAAYSLLLRMEWKKYGYTPVSAMHSDQYNSGESK